MSASSSVLIAGIDADRCWYNSRYNLVIYDLLAKHGELLKQCISMPGSLEEVGKALNDFKCSMLNLVLEHKKVNIAEIERELKEKFANWLRTTIIQPGMTQDELKSTINRLMKDFLKDIKCLDARTRHMEGYTIQFLIAAVANIPMISHVIGLMESFNELKLVSTSSRLTPQIERDAIQSSSSGSIYQDITELGKLLQHMLPGKWVSVNRYSSSDAFRNVEPGNLFNCCIESYWDDYKKPHALEASVDTTKLTQFYGAIHSSMTSDPSARYHAVIFDDLTTIRDALESCVIKHGEKFTSLIPCKLTYNVYEGTVSSTLTIDGKGSYNPGYSEAVANVCKKNIRLSCNQTFDWLSLFLKEPSIGTELSGISIIRKDVVRILFHGRETPKPEQDTSSINPLGGYKT